MRLKILFSILFLLVLSNCGAKKRIVKKKSRGTEITEPKPKKLPSVNEVKITRKLAKKNPRLNKETLAYIRTYAPIAVHEMYQYKIPASITLAQGILESGTGEGTLAKVGNNHFGIKCHRGWNGGRMYHDDDAKGECFRAYEDPAESYRDHSVFLSGRQRYAFLFKFHKRDYKAWARGLKKAGYATDPKYPKKLISIIQRYELYRYDTKKGVKAQSDKEYQKSIVRNTQDKIHSVEVGDTLYSIARQYSVSVNEIKKHNKLNDNTIFKGQELIIPKKK